MRSSRRYARGRRRPVGCPPPRSGVPESAARPNGSQRELWPTAGLVRSRFGSWGAALRACGYRPRWRPSTPDELVAALRRDAASRGAHRPSTTGRPRPPTARTPAVSWDLRFVDGRAAHRWACTIGAALERARDDRGTSCIERTPRAPAALSRVAASRGRSPRRRRRLASFWLLARGARGRRGRRAAGRRVAPLRGLRYRQRALTPTGCPRCAHRSAARPRRATSRHGSRAQPLGSLVLRQVETHPGSLTSDPAAQRGWPASQLRLRRRARRAMCH